MLEVVDPEGIFYRTSRVPRQKIARISCALIQWFKYRGQTTEYMYISQTRASTKKKVTSFLDSYIF